MWPFTRASSEHVPPVLTDAKSLASPSDDLLALFGVLPVADSGIALTPEGALKVPAVGSAIRLISEAAACLDVRVVEIGADGTEKPVNDHPVLGLLRDDANDWTSGFELIRDLVIDALSADAGGLVWVNRVDGRPVELLRYRNGVVVVEFDQGTGEPSYKIGERPEPAGNFVHLRSPFGRSPLTLYRDAIATAASLDRHAARLFGRGARPSGALMFPKGMGEESVKKARIAWRATHEGEDAGGRTAILYDGATFQPFTFSSVDAQFHQSRSFQILEVARAFRVPPPLLFELERATWGNAEQLGRDFLVYGLEPWLRALEGALRRGLLSEEERTTLAIRFDRDDLTRADLATRANAINSLIASRVLNPNEGRNWLGMAPYEGGNDFANPNITVPPVPDEGGDDAAE